MCLAYAMVLNSVSGELEFAKNAIVYMNIQSLQPFRLEFRRPRRSVKRVTSRSVLFQALVAQAHCQARGCIRKKNLHSAGGPSTPRVLNIYETNYAFAI